MALKRAMKEAILDLSLGISKASPEENDIDEWDEYTLVEPSIMVGEARVVGLYTLLHSYRCKSSCVLRITFFLLSSALTAVTASAGSGAGVDFNFISSPGIGKSISVNEIAVYHCSVNDTRVGLNWFINGTTTIPSNVTVTGLATPSSNLTILGLPQYNNTIVRCVASGYLDNNVPYNNFNESILRIQGKLAAVDLSCEQAENFCIQCSWNPPFSLTPIPQYITTNKGEDGLLQTNSTTTTNITYCPYQYGQYNISVAANNTAGLGNVTYKTVKLLPKENFDKDITYTSIDALGQWHILISIKNGKRLSLNPKLSMYLTNVNTNATSVHSISAGDGGKYSDENLVLSLNLGRLFNNTKWKLQFTFKYETFSVNSSTNNFSTFAIQNGTWALINANAGIVSFRCNFVHGSSVKGCFVAYKCINTAFNGNLSIYREPKNYTTEDTAEGIYNSTYTILFYDLDDLNVEAFSLTGQNILGINHSSSVTPSPTITSFTIISVANSSSTSVIPTLTLSDGSGATLKIVGVIASVVMTITIVISCLIIMVVSLFICKRRRSKSYRNENVNMEPVALQEPVLNYPQLEITMAAIKPPPVDLPTKYSNIKPHDPSDNADIYNKLNHSGCHTLMKKPSDEYDILQHDRNQKTTLMGNSCEAYSTISCFPSIVNATAGGIYSTINKTISSELSYSALTKHVVPHISDKWYEMGLALALTPDDLEELRENHQGINEVFMLWEEQKSRPFTWETLITTLKSIDKQELAEQLQMHIS